MDPSALRTRSLLHVGLGTARRRGEEAKRRKGEKCGGVWGAAPKHAWRWGTKTHARLSYLSLSDCSRRCRFRSRVHRSLSRAYVHPMRVQTESTECGGDGSTARASRCHLIYIYSVHGGLRTCSHFPAAEGSRQHVDLRSPQSLISEPPGYTIHHNCKPMGRSISVMFSLAADRLPGK